MTSPVSTRSSSTRWSSLQTRLLVALVGIAVFAVAAATLTIRQATQVEVRQYLEDVLADDSLAALDDFYFDHDTFDDVAPLLERLSRQTGRRIVIAEEDGPIVADSSAGQPLPSLETLFGDIAYELDDGTLLVVYVLDVVTQTQPQGELLAGVDRTILAVALVVVLAAIAVALLLARRLVRPLGELREAADALGRGDTSTRVPVDAPGEVGALANAFNEMAQRLERSEQARLHMTADTAHELRTPIANLRAYIEGMVDGVASPDGDDLAVLHDEVIRLGALVDDLQDLALVDAGALRLHFEVHDARDLLAHVAGAMAARALAAGVTIRADVPAPGVAVVADGARLLQVIGNLADNALAHAPRDSEVVLSAITDGLEAVLKVSDQGPGIPTEQQPAVFERLHRIDPSRSRNTGGAGLGLTIARQLVEAQHGSLALASSTSEGTTFEVRLPLAPAV